MQLQQTNYGNNVQQNGGQPTERKNFPVAKIYGSDGYMEVSMWKSNNNVMYTVIMPRQKIGQDPNGRTSYEAGLSKDIPNIMMRVDALRAIMLECGGKDPSTINFGPFVPSPQQAPDAKITITGAPSGVTITVENKVGTRKVTLNSTPVGDHNVHANWTNFYSALEVCVKKALLNRAADEITNVDGETPF